MLATPRVRYNALKAAMTGSTQMNEPTEAQARKLHELCHTLTNVMFQPIYIVRLDERTGNLFILAGREETIEFEVDTKGELVDEQI